MSNINEKLSPVETIQVALENKINKVIKKEKELIKSAKSCFAISFKKAGFCLKCDCFLDCEKYFNNRVLKKIK